MVQVVSHSLGVDDINGNRIYHIKYFKGYSLWCRVYILLQLLLEDYVVEREVVL